MKQALLLLAVFALVVAACGDSADTTTTGTPGTEATTTTGAETTTTAGATSTTAGVTTTAASTTTTTSAPQTTTTTTVTSTTTIAWIGEPYDFWVPIPEEGAIIGVVGVPYDDTLNVRSGPGIQFPVLAELDPLLDGITGTGDGWQLPSGSVWWEIETAGVTGWANQRFLSRLDGVDDLTSLVVDQLGEIPAEETMLALGETVAEVFDFGGGFAWAVTVPPSDSDLGEITIDVIGIGDDSLGGYRLHIFGQPTESGDGFSLMAVEATILCQRGVTGGICV